MLDPRMHAMRISFLTVRSCASSAAEAPPPLPRCALAATAQTLNRRAFADRATGDGGPQSVNGGCSGLRLLPARPRARAFVHRTRHSRDHVTTEARPLPPIPPAARRKTLLR